MADVKKINGYNIKDASARSDISSLESRVSSLELTVDTESTGLVDRVTSLETEINTPTTGIDARVTTLESEIGGKADSATTLAGYGITDAYTKTETDTAIETAIGNSVVSGYNANGNYIKFPDGTMMCWVRMTVTDQAIDTAYGTDVYTGYRTWTYPIAFIGEPSVDCSEFKWGSSASWGSVEGVTNTSADLCGFDFFERATGTNTQISATAIGRWK